jgi:hypothetical protein
MRFACKLESGKSPILTATRRFCKALCKKNAASPTDVEAETDRWLSTKGLLCGIRYVLLLAAFF